MNWSWLRRRPSLERLWSFEASGSIWRIIPLESGRILGEVRLHQEKRASFFCLMEKTGAVAWKDREFDETWWIGIEAVARGILILHTYEKPDLPEHRGMIALDVETGRELWRVPDVTFWFLTENRVYAHRRSFEARVVQEIVLSTGELVHTLDDALPELAQIRRAAEESIQTGEIALPAPSTSGDDPLLDRFVTQWAGSEGGVTGVESLRLDDYLLVSYYLPTGAKEHQQPRFNNHFRVVDLRKQKLIHTEILASAVPAIVPDTFYVRDGAIISIKDLRTLRAEVLPAKSPKGPSRRQNTRSER